MSWIKKMQDKWELKSLWQVVIVLVVFALTGSTVLLIKGPILDFISGGAEREWWMTVIYILLILPIYNVILLIYGFLLGQFAFFWKYEQKILRRFGYKKNAPEE